MKRHRFRDELIRWANSEEGTSVMFLDDLDDTFKATNFPSWGENGVFIVKDHQADLRMKLYRNSELKVFELYPTSNKWEPVDVDYKSIKVNKTYRLETKLKKDLYVYLGSTIGKITKTNGCTVQYVLANGQEGTRDADNIGEAWKPKQGDTVIVNEESIGSIENIIDTDTYRVLVGNSIFTLSIAALMPHIGFKV